MYIFQFIGIIFLFFITSPLNAEEEGEFKPSTPKSMDWQFRGPLGKFDLPAIQRGFKVYKEVCSSCHSLNKIAFRNLNEVGFSINEVKALAKEYQVNDEPNDAGEVLPRPAIASDYFVDPYPNKQAAASNNNGAAPPDLSLIIKARKNGANYVYSLLTGYENKDPDGTLYYNPYFSTGKIAMPPPLTDNLITYEDGTSSTIDNMAYDVVNFLQWTAEPEMQKRKSLGLKVLGFLIISLVSMIIAKKRIWKDLYKSDL